jgi:hypothetical protein
MARTDNSADVDRLAGMHAEAAEEQEAAGRRLGEAQACRDAALDSYTRLGYALKDARAGATRQYARGVKHDGLFGSYVGDAPDGLGMFIDGAKLGGNR